MFVYIMKQNPDFVKSPHPGMRIKRTLIQIPTIVFVSMSIDYCKKSPNCRLAVGGTIMRRDYFPLSLIAACAAARRAMGTRKGEQDT